MKYIHVCLQLVILISAIAESFTITQTFKAKLLSTGNFQIARAVGSSVVRSLPTCTNECFQNKKCMTFIYNKDTKRCILHSKTFKYSQPKETETGWNMYLLTENAFKANKLNNIKLNNNSTSCNLYLVGSRCPSDIGGFMHYRHLDLCYNFNPEHYIDYLGHIKQTCSSYSGELLRIDSQERQTYIEHILEGRTTTRVAIQGHSNNPGNVWTFDDGTQLPYTNWRSGDPAYGSHLQIFTNDAWTSQDKFELNKNNIFLCERIP